MMKSKMNRFLVIALCTATAIGIQAKERTETEMQQAAASVLLSHTGSTNRKGVAAQKSDIQLIAKASDLTSLKTINGEPFYIYGYTNGHPGYAIVSTDDTQPALLGYSIDATFQANNVPDNMAYYLDLLSRNNSAPTTRAKAEAQASVSPLLGDIAYHQGAPYNNQFPVYNGEHMIVGCGAVAVSQVMAYYKYPQHMTGEKISYTADSINYVWEWDPQATTFDWDKIKEQHSATAWDSETIPVGSTATDMQLREIQLYSNNTNYLLLNYFEVTEDYADPLFFRFLIVDNTDSVLAYGGIPYQYSNFSAGGGYTFILPHSVPGSLPDGEYRFAVGIKKGEDTGWQLITTGNSTSPTTIAFTKQGKSYTVSETEFTCDVSTSTEENQAVSTLVAACGAATRTQFSKDNSGSSTYSMSYGFALRNYMSYDDGISFIELYNYDNNEFEGIIRDELNANRPVILSGQSDAYGHTFVCDGYEYKDNLPYFHMNWGWGGYANGYFLMLEKEDAPASDVIEFTTSLGATIGIMPEDGVKAPFTLSADTILLSKSEVKVGDKMMVTVPFVHSSTLADFSGSVRLYAKSGNDSYLLGTQENVSTMIYPYEGGYTFTQVMISVTIPSTLPDAYYDIELRALSYDGEEEGYVHVPSTPTLKVGDPNEVPTGISTTVSDVASPTYSIDGKRLKDSTPKGIYIRSGKKYIGK